MASRVATAAKWTASVAGAVVIVGIQTPPDVVASNAALWVEKITGYLPDWPHWVDIWVTGLGVVLLLTPLIIWLWRKWRDRPGTFEGWLRYHERQRPLPSPPPPPKPASRGYDLSDAGLDGLERVARHRSQGRRRTFTEFVLGINPEVERLRTVQPPPADEWSRKAAARAAYEMRRITGGIGDPVAMGARLLEEDAKEEAKSAEKERRRALIKTGRDLAFGYCHGDQEETFREYLEGQRGYADIRPHLSEKYRRKLEAQRVAYADPQGAKYPTLVQWFLDDLDRLEKEWGLI
jgi:hypothetical protein